MDDRTIAIVEEWLRRQEPMMRRDCRSLDVDLLTRYASSTLSSTDARDVEYSVAMQPIERSRLRQVRDCLDELQTLAWSDVAIRGQGDNFAASVARSWIAILKNQVGAATRVREWWGSRSWTKVQEQVAEGIGDARAAWSLFVSFTRTLKTAMRVPELSIARGGIGGGPVVQGDVPENVEVVLTQSEVTADGTLFVTVDLRDLSGTPSDALDGKPIHLSLTVGGEAWHVVSGIMRGSRLQWRLPGLGSAMGLHAGEFSARFLHLTVGTPAPEARVGPLPVLADVLDSGGEVTPAPPAILELTDEPRWQNGQCTLTLAVPAETRSAYANHILKLDMVVSTERFQHLIARRVSEFGDDEMTLSISCPGIEHQASVPFVSIVRARLQAST